MRWKHGTAAALGCAGALAVACGGSDGGHGGGAHGAGGNGPVTVPDSVPLDRLAHEAARTVCSVLAGCPKPFLVARDCDEFEKAIEDQVVAGLKDVVARKAATYDPVKMSECLKTLAGQRCETRGDALPCSFVTTGTVPEGGACRSHFECESQYCQVDAACPGHCAPKPGLADPCPPHGGNRCAAGLECSYGTSTCVTPPGSGEPCTSDVPCAIGSECAAGTCVAATDVPVVGVGEACSLGGGPYCSAGSSCDTLDRPSTCQAPAKSGGPCRPGFPDPCPPSEGCSLAENTTNWVCQPLRKAGEECKGAQCMPGFACAGGGDVCVPLQRIGGACADNDGKDSDPLCYSGRCVAGKCTWNDACSDALKD